MSIKKIFAVASAAAVVSTLGVAAVASAAFSFSVSASSAAVMASDQVVVTAGDECAAADGALQLLVNGIAETANTTYSGNTITYTVSENHSGLTVALTANCVSGDGVNLGSSNELAVRVFGAEWVVSDPELFTTGEPVTISAGDFTPGAQVTLSLADSGGAQRFSGTLGTVGDNFSVSGQVTLPAELEPADYLMTLSDGTYSASVTLTVHPQQEPEPTQSPSPEPTDSPAPDPSPSPTASPTTSPQPGPGSSPSPTRVGSQAPGLPATGD